MREDISWLRMVISMFSRVSCREHCANCCSVWGEVSQWVADAAYSKGYIKTREVKAVEVDEEQALTWGLNSKGFAKRARKYLGWSPKGSTLKDSIPAIVDGEAELLGIKKGYAEKVTGSK